MTGSWGQYKLRLQSGKHFVTPILGRAPSKSKNGKHQRWEVTASHSITRVQQNIKKHSTILSSLCLENIKFMAEIELSISASSCTNQSWLRATFDTWITPFFSVTSIALDFRIAFKNLPICCETLHHSNSSLEYSQLGKLRLRRLLYIQSCSFWPTWSTIWHDKLTQIEILLRYSITHWCNVQCTVVYVVIPRNHV